MFILDRHASRNQTLGLVGRELLVEVSIPAQLRQVHSGLLMESFMPNSLPPSPTPTKAEVGKFLLACQATCTPAVGEFVVNPPAKLARKSPARSGTVRRSHPLDGC